MTVAATAAPTQPVRAPRALSLFDMTCIGVNAIVGSSIFLFPGKLAALLGPASVLAFALTGALLISVALCFAEAAGRFDGHGGPYLYAREAFGARAGYGIGWMCWLTQVVSWAAVANGIAAYLGAVNPLFDKPLFVKAVAAAAILTLGSINARGVKYGAWTSNLFTIGKLLPLALLIVVGLPKVSLNALAPFAPHGFKPLGAACFMSFFAYQGFEVVPVPAGECQNPRRNVPLALMGAICGSALIYMLIQTIVVAVEPNLATSSRPLADAASRLMGPAGASLIVAGSVLSMIGFCAGCALGGPRYLVALGEHGDLPPLVARAHARFGTPIVSIGVTTALSLIAAILLDFGSLVDITNVVVCAQYVATCAAVLVMRRRGGADSWRAPGGALSPIVGIVSTVWLGAQGGLGQVGAALILLVLGYALQAALRRKPA